MGLINHVIGRSGLFEQVTQDAAQFLPPKKATRAVGPIMRAVCLGLEIPLAEGLALERELPQYLFQSQDAHEDLSAFVEKRTAKFKRR